MVGDTITIQFERYARKRNFIKLVNCDEIEVTQSNSRLISQATIREFVGKYIYVHGYDAPPLLHDPSRTKIYKRGEEISFEKLKEGDILRINYTHCRSNGKDDTDGFYGILDSVVVLEEDIAHTHKVSGVITKIDAGKTSGGNYFYVTFCDGYYCARVEDNDNTIIKMREDGTEFAVDISRLRVGMTIDVFCEADCDDLGVTWLVRCKKIVIDTAVPIITPTVNPSDTPVPLAVSTN